MTRSCDDAAEALTHAQANAQLAAPPVTLTGYEATEIAAALAAAAKALAAAETAKLRAIREPARSARQQITTAWARLDAARTSAARAAP